MSDKVVACALREVADILDARHIDYTASRLMRERAAELDAEALKWAGEQSAAKKLCYLCRKPLLQQEPKMQGSHGWCHFKCAVPASMAGEDGEGQRADIATRKDASLEASASDPAGTAESEPSPSDKRQAGIDKILAPGPSSTNTQPPTYVSKGDSALLHKALMSSTEHVADVITEAPSPALPHGGIIYLTKNDPKGVTTPRQAGDPERVISGVIMDWFCGGPDDRAVREPEALAVASEVLSAFERAGLAVWQNPEPPR